MNLGVGFPAADAAGTDGVQRQLLEIIYEGAGEN